MNVETPLPKPKLPPKPNGGTARKAPPGAPPPASLERPASRQFTTSTGICKTAQRVVVYGPGGVGKTELCSLLKVVGVTPVFIDLAGGTHFLDVIRIKPPPETFLELLDAVKAATAMPECDAIVVDGFTEADEMSIAHTLYSRPHEKGHAVDSIEGYGFGKGYMHNFETFLRLLQSLEVARRAGKHIIGVCHDCTANVPNPAGEDWIRYEPRLQSPPSGKGSIRHRVKEWCDHLLYVGFDTYVNQDGKASGSGTRTIYPVEMPTHWAKSRSLSEPVVYEKGNAEIWQQLFGE